MPKALIIPADEDQPICIKNVEGLEAYQAIVGGYIEMVSLTLTLAGEKCDVALFCNEEGKLSGLPLNRRATEMARIPGDFLVGDVFLVGPPDDEGNETDVPLSKCFEALTTRKQ